MDVIDLVTQEDLRELTALHRQIHQHPELGSDLPNTVSVVSTCLRSLGIEPVFAYGRCSAAAYIGPESAKTTIAIRAEMDALPITEETGLAYASQIPGRMHACGHDAHTAILLTVARVLRRHVRELPCRVKLLFQPGKAGGESGAKRMADNGAVDDADLVLGTQVENTIEAGCIGVRAGSHMAARDSAVVTFHAGGAGADAMQMAVRARAGLETLIPELCGGEAYTFRAESPRAEDPGGAGLELTFSCHHDALREHVRAKCAQLCSAVASDLGGSAETDWQLRVPAVFNDEHLTAAFCRSVARVLPGALRQAPLCGESNDFAFLLRRKPGLIFLTGTRNEALGCTSPAGRSDFRIDEAGMRQAVYALLQFLLDRHG